MEFERVYPALPNIQIRTEMWRWPCELTIAAKRLSDEDRSINASASTSENSEDSTRFPEINMYNLYIIKI